MADLDYLTQDVTIKDDISGEKAYVTDEKRLQVDILSDENRQFLLSNWHWCVCNEIAFILSGSVTLANKNEADILLVRNAVASGIHLHWWQYIFNVLTSANVVVRGYRNPTITTNGTALTPHNLNADGSGAISNWYINPTISARGTLMEQFAVNSQTFTVKEEDLGYGVIEGEDMLISLQASSANTTIQFNALWAELSPTE